MPQILINDIIFPNIDKKTITDYNLINEKNGKKFKLINKELVVTNIDLPLNETNIKLYVREVYYNLIITKVVKIKLGGKKDLKSLCSLDRFFNLTLGEALKFCNFKISKVYEPVFRNSLDEYINNDMIKDIIYNIFTYCVFNNSTIPKPDTLLIPLMSMHEGSPKYFTLKDLFNILWVKCLNNKSLMGSIYLLR